MTKDRLRDVDHVVLQCVAEGAGDTFEITRDTIFETHQIRYSLKEKLAPLGLIELEKPDGMVERVHNGQKRVFEAPLEAELTNGGKQVLEEESRERDLGRYENLSRKELIERIHDHEQRIQRLETGLEMLKEPFQDH